MDSDVLAVVNDTRLSPEARCVVLYVQGLGPGQHEVSHREFARFLGNPGDKKVRAAVQHAVDLWLDRSAGGRGHHDRYEFRVPPGDNLNDSLPPTVNLNADRLAPGGNLSGASSPITDTPPPPTAGARVDDIHLEKLRRLLGAHAEVLDRFASSAKHAPTWARDIWCAYRPPNGEGRDGGGTEWAAMFAGEDEETAVRVLVLALSDYAEKGERYSGFLFRRYVKTARDEVRRVDTAALERTGTDGGPRRGREKPPQDACEYNPQPKPEWNG